MDIAVSESPMKCFVKDCRRDWRDCVEKRRSGKIWEIPQNVGTL